MTNRYRPSAVGGTLRLSDVKRTLGMEYPEEPELTFDEGAEALYSCAMSRNEKFSPAGLLERMTQVAMTLTGRGSGEVVRAWRGAELADRWTFCCEKAYY